MSAAYLGPHKHAGVQPVWRAEGAEDTHRSASLAERSEAQNGQGTGSGEQRLEVER